MAVVTVAQKRELAFLEAEIRSFMVVVAFYLNHVSS